MIKDLSESIKKIFEENIKIILIGLIAILMIISTAIILSLYFGGDVSRRPVISDIQGSAYITRDGKRFTADKNVKLLSGDVLVTEPNGSVRIKIDDDKYVFAEPDTSVYIYYTDIASKGDISVNLNRGAVICRLDNELKKNSSFVLKTPNGTVDVRGTVFRADFGFHEEYMGYENVMITEVQNFSGAVTLQLYDMAQQPFDLPMMLVERTCAQMITSEDICRYGYLNYNIDLPSLGVNALRELVKDENENGLAFTADEITTAFLMAKKAAETESDVSDTTVSSETTSTTATTTATETTVSETETVSSESETDPTVTTKETHIYTTYTGIKWWEITGNNPPELSEEDDNDDLSDNIIQPEITSTAEL